MAVDIAVGNAFTYTNVKYWLEAGAYGIVFGTYSDSNDAIAVKMAKISHNYKYPSEIGIVNRETIPMVRAANENWKHVVHAKKHLFIRTSRVVL